MTIRPTAIATQTLHPREKRINREQNSSWVPGVHPLKLPASEKYSLQWALQYRDEPSSERKGTIWKPLDIGIEIFDKLKSGEDVWSGYWVVPLSLDFVWTIGQQMDRVDDNSENWKWMMRWSTCPYSLQKESYILNLMWNPEWIDP